MTATVTKKMVPAGRDYPASHATGTTLYGKVKSSKVLIVGAGGIGCELLKNIVLTGFGDVEVVDLDTIDLSNLNRQFLFRQEHIKRSKALIAKETAGRFNPNAKITSHFANIKDKEFGVEWFRTFTIVFNALDNLDARRHVNRMCLAAGVPLIESGTTGFEGQVQVIKKGETECYDCNPKPTPKSYPVCTIRSTPSQPIHCIVWAKSYLFQEVFGTSEEDEAAVDHPEDADNAEEVKQLKQEAGELKAIRDRMGSDDFAEAIFSKVFERDIERLRSMEDMWKSRTPPTAFKWAEASTPAKDVDGDSTAKLDQVVWSQAQNVAVFNSSLLRLSSRLRAEQMSDPKAVLSFDKDDKDTLDFVAATANLRSAIFGIDPKSEFDIKQIAGNIIPAIATTNAMTASLCVVEALKILREQMRKAKMVFLAPRNSIRLANSEPPRVPNKDCAVCSVAVAELQVDADRAKLSDIVEGILKAKLAYSDEISISTEQSLIYDPDFDDNLGKNLAELKITDGTTLTVIDEDDGEEIVIEGPNRGVVAPRVNLSLIVKHVKSADGPAVVLSNEDIRIERKPRKAPESEAPGPTTNGVDQGQKRKRSGDDGDLEITQPSKKSKPAENDDIVLVEDQKADGAIIID